MCENLTPLSEARNVYGTRLCFVCQDFQPVNQFSKALDNVCQQHDKVPGTGEMRFCRSCKQCLPLNRFPSGQRRFLCRLCMWDRTGKAAKIRYRKRRSHIQRLWSMLYTDRAVFNQSHVGLTQGDIEKLLTMGSYTVSDSAGLAVVPLDPRIPLCIENAVLVTRERRRKLLGILAKCGPDDYLEEMNDRGSFIDACNMLPDIMTLPVCV